VPRRAMRQGTAQIRRGGDDSIGNFPVATVKRARKICRSSLTYCYTVIETGGSSSKQVETYSMPLRKLDELDC
jgi:hypothetical protein